MAGFFVRNGPQGIFVCNVQSKPLSLNQLSVQLRFQRRFSYADTEERIHLDER
jgi:hypothetical protein